MKKTVLLSRPILLANALALISLALPVGAQSVWNATNGISASTNWSAAANWAPNGVPGASTNVLFTDAAGVSAPGIINNVVDANLTIQQLFFRQTNTVVHNTLILPGVTLTISNSAAGTNLMAGTESSATTATTLMLTNTISGAGGTLKLTSTNVGSVISIRETTAAAAGSHIQVLDLSKLDTFNANIGNLLVGVFPGTAVTRPQGAFFLAKTNVITVLVAGSKGTPALDIGDTGASPDANNLLVLGISNSIAADSLAVGNQRSGGSMFFNPAFTNTPGTIPSLYLRGHANTRVVTFNAGDNSSATANIGSVTTGVLDFSGGTIDAMVNSMVLGNGQPIAGAGAGTATGTLTMTAGTLDVNTLEAGFQTTAAVTAASTGTINISGGSLVVNTNMRLAFYTGSGGVSKGTLNITNGSVRANNITAGGGTSAINMVGGKLTVTNTIGSLASPLSSLTVSSGATLQLAVSSGSVPVEVTTLASDNSGFISAGSLPAITGYPSSPLAVIVYQAGSGSGLTFSLGSLPGTFSGYISNDNTSTIWLVVTNGPSLSSVKWTGNVNSLWDTNTLNWAVSSTAAKYHDPDVVTFDDSAATGGVNLTATFAPTAWVQTNNTLNYTLSGTGSITGSVGLIMSGSASVKLAQTGGDNFSGGILVNAGTVVLDDANSAISGGMTIASGATAQIGNNDTSGALPAGNLDDEGTLIFNRSDTVLMNTAIPGAGALTKNGNGTLILGAANPYSGITTINAGTLILTNSGSISNSPQVNVTGATLDVSSVSGTTILTSLNLVNAGFTISAGSSQTNVLVTSITMGGSSNTINVSSLPVAASYPVTFTLVQTTAGISGFNLRVGTLPAGSGGSVALSGDGTAILLVLTNGPVGLRSSVTWIGQDALSNVNTNWSDRLNWQLPGAPVPADNVVFNDTATSPNGAALTFPGGGINAFIPGNNDNIVDTNFSISSLTYVNNGGSYHNTGLKLGVTLNVTNFLTVGAVDSASTLQTEFVTFAGTGGATLNVNNTNSNLQVWIGASGTPASQATLDLSALDDFNANISRLTVGACAINNAVNRPSGILYLARTNIITASFQATSVETGSTTGNSGIVLGDCNQNAGPASFLYLGQANTISADTIGIARQKSSGTVQFNPIYANTAPYPSVTFKGFSSTLVSIFDVGDGLGNSGTTSGTGDLNLAGGVVTATVDTLNVGRASNATSGSGNTTGSLEFDAGTITANTVNVGLQPVTGSKNGTGTITVGTNSNIGLPATLVVNGSLVIASNVNNAATVGILNINGGTVQAGSVVAGPNGATSTINLNAGTLAVSSTAGTTAAPITSLILSDATVLQLNVNGTAGITNIVASSIGIGGTTTLKIGSLTGVVTNVTYPLISYTGSDPYTGLSLALPAGYSGSLVDSNANGIVGLTLTVVPVIKTPHITNISVNGTTLNINATNGTSGGRYVLLGTTNLTLPRNQWTPVLTNNFNGSGNLNLSTNVINPALHQQFYILLQ